MKARLGEIGAGEIGPGQIPPLELGTGKIAARAVLAASVEERRDIRRRKLRCAALRKRGEGEGDCDQAKHYELVSHRLDRDHSRHSLDGARDLRGDLEASR